MESGVFAAGEARRARCSRCTVVAAAAAAAVVTTATSVIVTVTAGAWPKPPAAAAMSLVRGGGVTSMHSKSSNSLPSSNALCVGILAGATVSAHTVALAACATLVVLVAHVAVTLAAAPAQPSLHRLRPLRPRRSARLPHRCALVYARGGERAYASPRARALCMHARALLGAAAESSCCAFFLKRFLYFSLVGVSSWAPSEPPVGPLSRHGGHVVACNLTSTQLRHKAPSSVREHLESSLGVASGSASGSARPVSPGAPDCTAVTLIGRYLDVARY